MSGAVDEAVLERKLLRLKEMKMWKEEKKIGWRKKCGGGPDQRPLGIDLQLSVSRSEAFKQLSLTPDKSSSL